MKQSKIMRIRDLHAKVIHGDNGYTEEEYEQEDTEIKKLNEPLLALVCLRCFPLSDASYTKLIKTFSRRTGDQYALDYPKVNQVVEANEWNERLAKK